MQEDNRTLRLRVSPQVARLVTPGASRDLQLAAARGELQIDGSDLITALLFLANGGDPEIRRDALATLKAIPAMVLAPLLADPAISPRILDFLARLRVHEPEVIQPLLAHPAVAVATLARVAAVAGPAVLPLIRRHPLASAPEVAAALAANPGGGAPVPEKSVTAAPEADEEAAAAQEMEEGGAPGSGGETEEEMEEETEAEEAVNPSKYKQSLEMEVSEKIKFAMTGDKEWRTIFLKDPNKLVSSAALKNPRITEAEVLTLAKNKSTNDELIRLIVINREWIKNFAIRKALVMHPKTPLPKALRYMDSLGIKDLKALGKSKNVSPALANNARRLVLAREKKR